MQSSRTLSTQRAHPPLATSTRCCVGRHRQTHSCRCVHTATRAHDPHATPATHHRACSHHSMHSTCVNNKSKHQQAHTYCNHCRAHTLHLIGPNRIAFRDHNEDSTPACAEPLTCRLVYTHRHDMMRPAQHITQANTLSIQLHTVTEQRLTHRLSRPRCRSTKPSQ